jgi:hypothetical protein
MSTGFGYLHLVSISYRATHCTHDLRKRQYKISSVCCTLQSMSWKQSSYKLKSIPFCVYFLQFIEYSHLHKHGYKRL